MRGFRVLVIDDDPTVLETAAELLQSEGYTVVRAGSGHDGVAMARTEQPHLILLDFDMPGMGGVAVMSALRADPSTARIPVVAFTAATAMAAEKLVRAGCIGYIPKPFNNPEFSRAVAGFIKATVARAKSPQSAIAAEKTNSASSPK